MTKVNNFVLLNHAVDVLQAAKIPQKRMVAEVVRYDFEKSEAL
jgi:hypothetical protein